MLEEKGNLWNKYEEGKTICIPTNGYITRKGRAAMGRGLAAQALERFPEIDLELARALTLYGNVVQEIAPNIIAFPIKPGKGVCSFGRSNVVSHLRHKYNPGYLVPGYAMKADLELIRQSLYALWLFAHYREINPKIYIPRVGCGAGELSWENVRPLCAQYGNWLTVVEYENQ